MLPAEALAGAPGLPSLTDSSTQLKIQGDVMNQHAVLARWQLAVAVFSISMYCCGAAAAPGEPAGARSVEVTGTGTDLSNGAIVHSRQETAHGEIRRSTEIIELRGDLTGKVLYHVTSTYDSAKEILLNTGEQVFSGTIAGSDPVMIRDSRFRFEVNLKTGEDSGDVYLLDPLAGPRITCTLHVVGTGKDADGNPLFRYTGHCTFGPGVNRSGS